MIWKQEAHPRCSSSKLPPSRAVQLAEAFFFLRVTPLQCVWSLGTRTQILPPSPLSTLGRAHSLFREPECMRFHCLGWQPGPNLSTSSRTACWTAREQRGITEELFEKSPGFLLMDLSIVFSGALHISHVGHFCAEAFQWRWVMGLLLCLMFTAECSECKQHWGHIHIWGHRRLLCLRCLGQTL